MAESRRRPSTLFTRRTDGRFASGVLHPKYTPDDLLLGQLADLLSTTTRTLTGRIEMRGRSRVAEVVCGVCRKQKWIYVDAIRDQHAGCTCQRGKYKDPRAHTLGQRYDAMVQRCERDTHVSSRHYKGRGIEVRFESREQFIRWALAAFPHSDFQGLDLDRIDNDGHYEPANLRLVPRSVNLRNRRRSEFCKAGHPLSGSNLRLTKQVYRVCRECMKRHMRNFWERKRLSSMTS